MKPLLVLQHDPTQGPGLLADHLVRTGIPFKVVMPDHGDRVPISAHAFSAIALLGSNRSVNDPLAWIRDEIRLVQSALALDRPLLGHCFGAQMMARALGARVHRASTPHMGWSRLDVTPWGLPLLQEHQVTAFNWHYETFEMPARAHRLLFGRHCLNKGFAIGPHLAFQCHFEVNEAIVRRWCSEGQEELATAHGPAVQDADAILAALPLRMPELRRTAHRVYSAWIERVVRQERLEMQKKPAVRLFSGRRSLPLVQPTGGASSPWVCTA